MNMPGFNAEASLYKTRGLYRTSSIDAIAIGQVVPQAPPKPGGTQSNCKTECKKSKPYDLDWSVACDDYCRCLYTTDNPVQTCKDDFKDDTDENPPLRRRPVIGFLDRGTVVGLSA